MTPDQKAALEWLEQAFTGRGMPVVGEWNVKMRMVFGGPAAFEFELPPMAMSQAYVDNMVDAFRAAVEKANTPSHTPAPL